MKDFDQIHDIILDKLDAIQSQTTKTNGRVTDLEKETIAMKKDIAAALKIISGHSTIITYHKQDKDKAQEDLIKLLQTQLAELQKKVQEEKEKRDEADKKFNQRILYGAIVGILFIASVIGLIDPNFMKVLLGAI